MERHQEKRNRERGIRTGTGGVPWRVQKELKGRQQKQLSHWRTREGSLHKEYIKNSEEYSERKGGFFLKLDRPRKDARTSTCPFSGPITAYN